MNLPFKEDIISGETYRTFSEKTDQAEFMWHRDRENRKIKAVEKTDWMFQLDNELPKILSEKEFIFVPAGVYHRIIKGSGNITVQIKFLD